jgi:hypothetical protein
MKNREEIILKQKVLQGQEDIVDDLCYIYFL